jgi:hypothetical protein
MDGSGTTDRVDRAALSRQWRQERRYEEIAEFRQQVKEATKKAWKAEGRQWDRDELNEVAWREAERAFPPLDTGRTLATDSQSELAHGGRVTGISDIPSSWPELPANASLAAEIQWVQANRLRVVQGDSVDLSRSLSHAPSHAALGWLETAILFPAIFTDVAVKATQHQEDEKEAVRREKLAIEDVRGLLAEMLEDGDEGREGAICGSSL